MSTATASRIQASLPLDPLWRLAAAKSGVWMPRSTGDLDKDRERQDKVPGFGAATFAEMVRHDVRAVTRWRQEGRIPWISADKASCALGYVPVLAWGDEWLNVKGDYAKIARGAYDHLINSALDEITEHLLVDVRAEVEDDLTRSMASSPWPGGPEHSPYAVRVDDPIYHEPDGTPVTAMDILAGVR